MCFVFINLFKNRRKKRRKNLDLEFVLESGRNVKDSLKQTAFGTL